MYNHLNKPIKITVCKDGAVSIRFGELKPRQNAALPCYSVDTLDKALLLIRKVCHLSVYTDDGDNTTVEPKAPNWGGNIEDIAYLTEVFKKADTSE